MRRHIAEKDSIIFIYGVVFFLFSTFSTIASAEVFTSFHIGSTSAGLGHSQFECFQDLGATCATSSSNQGVICSDYGAFASSSSSFSGLGQYVACMGSVCPVGSTEGAENNRCICDDGQELNNDGTCPLPTCTVDDVLSSGFYVTGTDPTTDINSTACFAGCTAVFNGDGAYKYLDIGVEKYGFIGDFIADGTNCADGSGDALNPLNEMPQNDCGLNSATLTQNGETVCVDASGNETSADNVADSVNETDTGTTETIDVTITENTVDNGDGTSTTTTTETTTNSDGSGSTTTTATTTNNGTGATESENTTTTTTPSPTQDPLKAFCDEYPNNSSCLESKESGGTGCVTPPTCSGDAIQCAIDRRLWKIGCDLESDATAAPNCSTPPTCTGDAVGCILLQSDFERRCAWDTTGSTVTQATIDSSLGTTQTLDEFSTGTDIDASDPTDGYTEQHFGSCPANFVVPLSAINGTFTFSWSNICTYVDYIRIIVLLIAYFISALIFYSAFFKT